MTCGWASASGTCGTGIDGRGALPPSQLPLDLLAARNEAVADYPLGIARGRNPAQGSPQPSPAPADAAAEDQRVGHVVRVVIDRPVHRRDAHAVAVVAHAGDDLLPEPYTSTSSEAVSLRAVASVVVTRMTTNPTAGPRPPAEAVLTIGWGAVSRVDLEPAACADPQCEADHGYTGTSTSDDFSLRVSAAADGTDAVGGVLAFAAALSALTRG